MSQAGGGRKPLAGVFDRLGADASGRFSGLRSLSLSSGTNGSGRASAGRPRGPSWLRLMAVGVSAVWAACVGAEVVAVVGWATLFSFHPLTMLASCVLAVAATMSYYGDAKTEADVQAQRAQHRVLMLGAAGCGAVGMVAIVANKIARDKPVIPQSWHAWLGAVVVVACVVQVVFGKRKIDALPVKTHRWHGTAGSLALALLLLTSVVGAWKFFGEDRRIAGVLTAMGGVLVWSLVWRVRRDGRPLSGRARYAGVPGNDDDEESETDSAVRSSGRSFAGNGGSLPLGPL